MYEKDPFRGYDQWKTTAPDPALYDDTVPDGACRNEIELVQALAGFKAKTCADARGMLRKWAFRYTICGAYVEFESGSIVVGSIVEGVEEQTAPIRLHWPFPLEAYTDALRKTEEEAQTIWDRTHGCLCCAGEGQWDPGNTPVAPDCPCCHGKGVAV